MAAKNLFQRDLDADNLVEAFMVSSVASILLIRFYLELTGFPQIGGGGLHIAHMLWGGFLMLISIVILLNYLNYKSHMLASILGGVGFGAFIDELGKFITQDNNYFFQPAIALIYVIFILVYLAFRKIEKHEFVSEEEYIINALEQVKNSITDGYDKEELKKALRYIKRGNDNNKTVKAIEEMILKIEGIEKKDKSFLDRINSFFGKTYEKAIEKTFIRNSIVIFFIFQAIIGLLSALLIPILLNSNGAGLFAILHYDFWDLGEIFFSGVSAVIIFIGVFKMRISRLAGYKTFKISILIAIFITQFFSFYNSQLEGVFGLIVNIIMLFALDEMIKREKILQNRKKS